MISSLTIGTLKQYDNPLRLWWEFCKAHGFHLYSASITQILLFLKDLFDKVKSYGTLNSYRSALSLIMNNELGNDPRIRRFFKGVASLKPQKPRYSYTWDPATVLDWLSKVYPNEEISLEKLSKKLVILLALITAQRVQTLALIKLENIKVSNNEITITIPDRIKTTGRNRDQPLLNIPFFREQPSICVAETLRVYISRTEKLRSDSKGKLFLSIRKPHKAVTSQSISRWIKEILEKSGINTKIFSAHSTRHAATSAAYSRGVDIESIRKTAGWSKSSAVFARFYNRPLIKTKDFAATIMECVSQDPSSES